MRGLVLIIITFCICVSVYAQQNAAFRTIDSTSFTMYEHNRWDELTAFGQNAIEDGTDYFYLRMRTGIAFFEKRQYRKAIEYFNKALGFNASDQMAMEYLFYSYLWSGRTEDAKFLLTEFPDQLLAKLESARMPLISGINTEGGTTLTKNIDQNKTIDIDETENISGQQDMNGPCWYTGFGIAHHFIKRISFFQSVNLLNIEKTKRMTGQASPTETVNRTNNYLLSQKEYYVNAKILVSDGTVFTPALHIINVTDHTLRSFLQPNGFVRIMPEDTSFTNYAGSLSISKETGIFNIGLFASFSNLNKNKQIQAGTVITIYPLNNLNLYTRSTFSIMGDRGPENVLVAIPAAPTVRSGPGSGPPANSGPGNNNATSKIFDQLIGVKIFPELWLEGYVTFGNMKNFLEKDAYIIYNTSDMITFRTGGSLLIPVSNKLKLSLHCGYTRNESYYIKYVYQQAEHLFQPQKIKTNYHTLNLTGGLSWTL